MNAFESPVVQINLNRCACCCCCCYGIAPRVCVRSRCWDACMVVDGGTSFEFNDGAIATISMSEEDHLRTVVLWEAPPPPARDSIWLSHAICTCSFIGCCCFFACGGAGKMWITHALITKYRKRFVLQYCSFKLFFFFLVSIEKCHTNNVFLQSFPFKSSGAKRWHAIIYVNKYFVFLNFLKLDFKKLLFSTFYCQRKKCVYKSFRFFPWCCNSSKVHS